MIKIYQSIYKADGLKIKVDQNQNIMKALIHECHSGKVNNRKTRAQNQNQKREKLMSTTRKTLMNERQDMSKIQSLTQIAQKMSVEEMI